VRFWRGDVAVRRSLLIGLGATGIVLVLLLKWVAPQLVLHQVVPLGTLTVVLTLLVLAVVIWQLVGVTRSWRKHYAGPGAGLDALCMRGAVLCYGCVIAFSLLDLSKFTLDPSIAWTPLWFRPHTEIRYDPLNDLHTIYVTGKIEFGLGRRLKGLLDTHPEITRLELNSPGGVISEARGVGLLVRERALDTIVVEQCFSACTLIYVSGRQRLLHDRAQLARAFATPHSEMWTPGHGQLIASGLVHHVISATKSK